MREGDGAGILATLGTVVTKKKKEPAVLRTFYARTRSLSFFRN